MLRDGCVVGSVPVWRRGDGEFSRSAAIYGCGYQLAQRGFVMSTDGEAGLVRDGVGDPAEDGAYDSSFWRIGLVPGPGVSESGITLLGWVWAIGQSSRCPSIVRRALLLVPGYPTAIGH